MTILRGAFQSPRKQSKTGRSISRESDLVVVPTMARPPHSRRRRTSFARDRQNDRFSHLATLVIVLDEEEVEHLGSKLGCKNTPRVRKSVEKMILELGISARKALRMDPNVFYHLHDVLEAGIAAKFCSRKAGDATGGQLAPNGLVSTKLRLSCAMRCFAGAAVYDLILTHGMGRSTIYQSIWGIVDVINQSDDLALNADSAPFPSIAEQEDIAAGFLEKSRVGFDNVIGAIDALLVTIDYQNITHQCTQVLTSGTLVIVAAALRSRHCFTSSSIFPSRERMYFR